MSPSPTARRQLLTVGLALAAVLAILFGPSLFGGKVLCQLDALGLFEPWKAHQQPDFEPGNELLLDQSLLFAPWAEFEAERIHEGELPLWNPYNFCGQPLLAAYQSATFWPLQWIYFAWPSWDSLAWIASLKLLLSGMFMLLFLRRLGVTTGAAAVGGLGFMLCGFQIAWLNHAHSNVAMLLPALMWAVERMAATPGRRNAALFALLVGLQFVAGHVQTATHIALFVALYALCRTRIEVQGRRLELPGLLSLGGGALLGLMLAMPQILPFLEYLSRSQSVTVFENQEVVEGGNLLSSSIMMVLPNWFGAPHHLDYTGPLGPSLNYNELIGGYVGALLLLLAVLQATWLGRRDKQRGLVLFFTVAVVVAALVSWRVWPVYDLFSMIPKLRSTKLMRFSLFVAFGLCALGSMGLATLATRWGRDRNIVLGAFALVAAELLWFAYDYTPQLDPDRLLPETEVTDYLQQHQGLHRALPIENQAVMPPNSNMFYDLQVVAGYDSMEDAHLTSLLVAATNHPPKLPFITDVAVFDRIEAQGLWSLLGVKHILSLGELPLPKVLDAECKVYENPAVMPRAFLADRVEVVPDFDARVARMTGADFDPRVAILGEEPAAETRDWPRETGVQAAVPERRRVEISCYAPCAIDIEVASPERALLVLSDIWDAGWQASVEPRDKGGTAALDVEILRADHALRGVFVEPGDWLLRMRYRPVTLSLGLWLGALAALGILVLALARRKQAPAPS